MFIPRVRTFFGFSIPVPGASFTPLNLVLTPDQQKNIESRSGVRVRSRDLKACKVSSSGWFIVDQVLGKHEYITYALGLNAGGTVKQIEILDYWETYGSQVREASWRQQFSPGHSFVGGPNVVSRKNNMLRPSGDRSFSRASSDCCVASLTL